MAQFFRYPTSSSAVTISAIGTNGATAPVTSIEVGGINPTGNLTGLKTDASGNLLIADAVPSTAKHVIVDSSALPSGAATSANQTTQIVSLSSIDTKTPALGQALAAASVPVVLTAAQLSTLTPLSSVTVTQATGTNLHVTVDNFPASQTVSGTVAATQSGTWNITNVSGTVSLPTGASTSSLQSTGNTSIASIDTKTPALGQALAAASVPVVLTAAQITTLTPLSTVTVNQGTANATPWNENVAQINGVTPLMGNGVTGTGSLRVTLASDTSSNTNPLLTNARQTGTLTDRSGTTSGTPSTSTTIMSSNASRKYLVVQNVSTVNTIWINFTSAATTTQPSIQLLPGGSMTMESGFVSTEAVTVICTAASSVYTAKEG